MVDGIRVFVLTVQLGSFASAARRLGVTPSAVSRRIARLEEELGASLLARTTRTLRLTPDGLAFHDRCARALAELDDARDALASARTKPSGLLRIEAGMNLGRTLIGPALPRFLDRYPDVRVELTLRDQLVDPVAEGIDVLIRIGPLIDSSLIAKKLGESRMIRLASPAYLKKHGRPRTIDELTQHRCLGFLDGGRPRPFTFVDDHGTRLVEVNGPCHVNDGAVLGLLAAQGHGIITLFDFMANDWIERGELVPILEDVHETTWPIHALYPSNRHLLPKVRVFLDYVARVFRDATKAAAAASGTRAIKPTSARPRRAVARARSR